MSVFLQITILVIVGFGAQGNRPDIPGVSEKKYGGHTDYIIFRMVTPSNICGPFYRNETLLCKTPNEDMTENMCGGDFLSILRFLHNYNCFCVSNVLCKF